MADRKITALTELTAALADDLLLVVDESEAENSSARNKKLKVSSLLRVIEDGTAATPTLSFAGTSTGFYGVDSSAIGLSHNGTQTASLSYTTSNSVVQPRYSIGLASSLMSGTTDAPLHIRQPTTDDAEAILVCESDEGSSVIGPVIELRRKSGAPSSTPGIGAIKFSGNNDASPTKETVDYSLIQATILDTTDGEEDGRLEFLTQHGNAGMQPVMFLQNKKVGIGNVPTGGTLVPDVELHVKSDIAGSQVEIECTEVSAASGADLVLYRHRNGAAGVANDVLSTIKFRGKEATATITPNDENYAFIRASIVDPNLALPEGKLELIVDPDRANPTTISLVTDLISFSSPIALDNGSAPAARTSPGTEGEIRWDYSYLYLCTSTGTSSAVPRWTRIALDSSW